MKKKSSWGIPGVLGTLGRGGTSIIKGYISRGTPRNPVTVVSPISAPIGGSRYYIYLRVARTAETRAKHPVLIVRGF